MQMVQMVDSIKTFGKASAELTIMGVAMTVIVKWQFYKTLFLCYLAYFVDTM